MATNLTDAYNNGVPLMTGLPFGSRYFFVDENNANASDSGNNDGTMDYPFDTIDYAIGRCTANKGHVIVVMPGHTETIVAAAGIDADVAGITIVGIGEGSVKPVITWGTATTATWKVNAANIKIKNFRCVGNIDSLVKFFDINADYATFEDINFVTSSTKEALSFFNLATTKDYLTVRRCTAEQPTDPAGTDGGADTGFLYCVDSEYILFEDCHVSGMFETAIFHNRTTKCRNLRVVNCYGNQLLSGAEPFQLVADVDGGAWGGLFLTPAEAAATEATLVGTIGDKFFVSPTCTFGNDGAAGGQGGIIVATAS